MPEVATTNLNDAQRKVCDLVKATKYGSGVAFLKYLLMVEPNGVCKFTDEEIFDKVNEEFNKELPLHNKYWYPSFYRDHYGRKGHPQAHKLAPIAGVGTKKPAQGEDVRKEQWLKDHPRPVREKKAKAGRTVSEGQVLILLKAMKGNDIELVAKAVCALVNTPAAPKVEASANEAF